MRILLDTHVLLWALGEPTRLPDEIAALLDDRGNALVFSAVSLWEITIKGALGRPDFNIDPRLVWRTLVDHDYQELPVRSEHALAVGDLPALHKDPFDRLLIAQMRIERLLLLTSDPLVARYPGSIRTFAATGVSI